MKALNLFVSTLLVTLGTVQAQADIVKKSCVFKDYQFITESVRTQHIVEGAEKKNTLLSVLAQEMGPICNELIETGIKFGIPGDKTRTFELIDGSKRGEVQITRSIEHGKTLVRIR